MDLASVDADEQFALLAAERDQMLERLEESVAALRKEAAKLTQGNRFQRRKAKGAIRRIDKFESWFGARIRQVFEQLTNGYDPDLGVFESVQREASEKLAAIFS